MRSKTNKLADTLPPSKKGVEDAVRVGALDTVTAVRAEFSRLYRATRKGCGSQPTPSEAAKLGFLLQQIGQLVVSTELEQRIRQLESQKETPK